MGEQTQPVSASSSQFLISLTHSSPRRRCMRMRGGCWWVFLGLSLLQFTYADEVTDTDIVKARVESCGG